jgi:hypothetical protein
VETHFRQKLKHLFETQSLAVLSTCREGHPYSSLIGFVATGNLRSIVFATLRHTRKYDNIVNNQRISILIDSRTNSIDELGRKSFDEMRWEEMWDASLRIRNLFMNTPLPPTWEMSWPRGYPLTSQAYPSQYVPRRSPKAHRVHNGDGVIGFCLPRLQGIPR